MLKDIKVIIHKLSFEVFFNIFDVQDLSTLKYKCIERKKMEKLI